MTAQSIPISVFTACVCFLTFTDSRTRRGVSADGSDALEFAFEADWVEVTIPFRELTYHGQNVGQSVVYPKLPGMVLAFDIPTQDLIAAIPFGAFDKSLGLDQFELIVPE